MLLVLGQLNLENRRSLILFGLDDGSHIFVHLWDGPIVVLVAVALKFGFILVFGDFLLLLFERFG